MRKELAEYERMKKELAEYERVKKELEASRAREAALRASQTPGPSQRPPASSPPPDFLPLRTPSPSVESPLPPPSSPPVPTRLTRPAPDERLFSFNADPDDFPGLAPPTYEEQIDLLNSSGCEISGDENTEVEDADDEGDEGEEGETATTIAAEKVPPPPPRADAFVSPSGQVKSKDMSTIHHMKATGYGEKVGRSKRANQRPSIGLTPSTSTLTDEGSSLPTQAAALQPTTEVAGSSQGSRQSQTPLPSSALPSDIKSDNFSESGIESGRGSDGRPSRAYSKVLNPMQHKIFMSRELTSDIWQSVAFQNPFLRKHEKMKDITERFHPLWKSRHKVLGPEVPAPWDSIVATCVSTSLLSPSS